MHCIDLLQEKSGFDKKMAERYIRSARTAKTFQLSDLDALRRQLDEIELNLKEDKNGNIRIDKIKNNVMHYKMKVKKC